MDDAPQEWKIRAGALPVAVALALLFHSWDLGHFAQRTALTMPLHELGHAITGWWCGFAAVPTLWKTMIPETRGVIVPVVLLAASGYVGWRGWTTDRMGLVALAGAALALQFLGTVASSVDSAHEMFTFGGDAGAMVLGTVLMMLFFVGPESKLRAGGLRYGLLGIGAAALVDTFATWWRARKDHDVIPFGEIEGVGLSDPSKLDEVYGWTVPQIVDRYVMVGTVCVLALVAVWVRATWITYRDAH